MSQARIRQPGRRLVLEAAIGLLLLAVAISLGWYVGSPQFNRWAHDYLVRTLENSVGGKVEFGNLELDFSKLEFVATDLTIHGLEAPDEIPYAHADRVVVRLKLRFSLRQRIGLRFFRMERPVVHLIVLPDGRTNQPTPRIVSQAKRSAVEQLFDLAINRAEISGGILLLNDRPIPIDLAAQNLRAEMAYVRADKRYDGRLQAGMAATRVSDLQPVRANTDIQFSLWHNKLQLKSMQWTSERSRLALSGSLANFAQPQAEATWQATLDLSELGRLAPMPEVRQGVVEVDGQGQYADGKLSSAGKLALRNLEYHSASLRIPNLNLGAKYTLDDQRLAVSNLFASLLGGTVVGKAEVRNWRSWPSPQARSAANGSGQQGAVNLRLAGLAAGRMAEAVSTPGLPLARLEAVGAASGRVDITWKGTPAQAVAEFALEVAPPASVETKQLPVSAAARGRYAYASGSLQLDEANLVARSLSIDAAGQAQARSSSLQVVIKVGDLHDAEPLATVLRPGQPLPPGLAGHASFQGTVSGSLKAPLIAGNLRVADFEVPRETSAAAPASPSPTQFDLLSADVQYSPAQLSVVHGVLQRRSARATFQVKLGLEKGSFTVASPINAQVGIHDLLLDDLQALAGYDYPLTGTLQANLQIGGTRGEPTAQGRFEMARGSLLGEPLQSASGELVFAAQEVELRNLLLRPDGARVSGTAAYNLKTTAFRFDLQGSDLELARLQHLRWKRMSVAGKMDFHARASGTKDAPRLDAEVHLRDVVLNGETMGALRVQADTSGDTMRLTARSDFVRGSLELTGTVGLRDPFPARMNLRLARLDVDSLLTVLLKGRITGHSSANGAITVDGPLREPQRLAVAGNLDQFAADVENIRLHNDGPLRFSVSQQLLQLDQFRLVSDTTRLSASGTVALSGTRLLNLQADGHVNLELLEAYAPRINSSGTLDFSLSAVGTLQRPVVQGQARVRNGALAYGNLPNGLSDIDGVVLFSQEGAQIQKLTARSGGGDVTVGGFVTFSGDELRFNLTASGREMRLRYPQGVSTVWNADLQLSGTPANATLSGEAIVTRFNLTQQFDLALLLASSKQPSEVPNPKSPLNNLRLDVHVTSTPELQVQTSLAKVSGQADLRLRGTAKRPVLLGRISIAEGEVNFNGTKYSLERGDIAFTSPVGIVPVVDIEATTRVRDYDVTIGFHGQLDRPGALGVSYRSDPPLPTADIIGLLAFGRTREEGSITEANPSLTQAASNAILGQALNMAVSSRVQRLFGVSRIKIAPELGGTEANPNARVTIEQQVSPNITFTYISDIAHSTQPAIMVEYNVNRNLFVVASRDQNGVVAFDVRIRRRKQ
jgi:translocation and assembly module TamB